MVEITVSWGGEFQGSEANVIKSFIIDAHDFVSIFNKLMH